MLANDDKAPRYQKAFEATVLLLCKCTQDKWRIRFLKDGWLVYEVKSNMPLYIATDDIDLIFWLIYALESNKFMRRGKFAKWYKYKDYFDRKNGRR